MSYARVDNDLPPQTGEKQGRGFVTALHEQLEHEFRQIGPNRPVIWRDIEGIDDAEQFDPKIAAAIKASEILLVVLSPNWMSREYCLKELDLFGERWQHEGDLSRRRIIVASKRHIEFDRRPSLLQGQTGYNFFAFQGHPGRGLLQEFYRNGFIRDDRYATQVEKLGSYLFQLAERLAAGEDPELPRPETVEKAYNPPAPDSKRVIYLAKPAKDMSEAYDTLVEELHRNGYIVVPDPVASIPFDSAATAYIDNAMKAAELSIHLLGEGAGFAPEGAEPRVHPQLRRAALRADDRSKPGFRRIIWAPRLLHEGSDDEEGEAPAGDPVERNPFDVIKRFDREIDSDSVQSDSLSKFVTFLTGHLKKVDPTPPQQAELRDGATIYVFHERRDAAYAINLARAMRSKNDSISTVFPATEGDPSDLIRIHRRTLLQCDAVILCWASAAEGWARAHANELDWKTLGRSTAFAYRSIVAGPPPGDRKSVLVEFPPRNEVDFVVDLTKDDTPLLEKLEPLVRVVPSASR